MNRKNEYLTINCVIAKSIVSLAFQSGVEFPPPGVLSSRCIEPSVNGEITRATPFFFKLDEKTARR
jgi:hypothetical protein